MSTTLDLFLDGVGSATCRSGTVRGSVRGGAQRTVGVQQVRGLALHFGILAPTPLEPLDETGLDVRRVN